MSFDLHSAESIEQALSLARTHGTDARYIAGGTDLMIQINRRRKSPRHLVDISRIEELSGLNIDPGLLTMGALTTHKTIERNTFIGTQVTALAEAACVVGGHQIRNIATIGGNVANASPAADVAVALLALGARVELAGHQGTRTVAIEEFFLGPGQTSAQAGEIIVRIETPLFRNSASAFLKAGRRKAMEISVVCVATRVTLDSEELICRGATIALGAVAPTPWRAKRAEAHLAGQKLTPQTMQRAGEIAAQDCAPLDDVRASAAYRRILVQSLVPRALALSLSRIEGKPR